MKTYTDYPDYYFKILDDFETSTDPFTIPGTWGELTAVRHNLNRFFKTLRTASNEDDYARKLYRIAEKVRFSLSPGRANYSDDAIMTAKLDPLYKAVMDTVMPSSGR